MEQNNVNRWNELKQEVSTIKKTLSVFAVISVGLLYFAIVIIAIMYSLNGPIEELVGPLALLMLIDIPLLLITRKIFKSYTALKKEMQELSNKSKEIQSEAINVDKQKLYIRVTNYKTSRIITPIFMVIVLMLMLMFMNDQGLTLFFVYAPMMIIALIVGAVQHKKNSKKLEELGGLTEAEIRECQNKIRKNNRISIIVLIIIAIAIAAIALPSSKDAYKDKYDDVFKKDPNTWTEDEKTYVDNFFEWQKDHY